MCIRDRDTGIALMEATPSEPTRAALKLTRITPGNGTLEVELTGTAGQNVTVALTTMEDVYKRQSPDKHGDD